MRYNERYSFIYIVSCLEGKYKHKENNFWVRYLVKTYMTQEEMRTPVINMIFLFYRPKVRWQSCKGIHFKNVYRFKPRYGENYLLALHLRHRHREHTVCVRRSKGHDPTTKFKRIQFGLEIYLIPNLRIRQQSSDHVLLLQRSTTLCDKTRQLSLDFKHGSATSRLFRCHRWLYDLWP